MSTQFDCPSVSWSLAQCFFHTQLQAILIHILSVSRNDCLFAISVLRTSVAFLSATMFKLDMLTRGVQTTIFFLKVSPIEDFYERIDLVLVPNDLDQSFLRDFGPKFGLFLAISGGQSAQNAKIRSLLLLNLKNFVY